MESLVSSLLRGARISKSLPLTVVVERDLEEAPDDPNAWVVVRACTFDEPEFFGAGYLHSPSVCACKDPSSLCDIGWLEVFVSCAGAKALTDDVEEDIKSKLSRMKLRGRMVSERIESIEDTD